MSNRRFSTEARLLFILLTLTILSLPTSSQTDNCFGVDRQCDTDEQWIRGWWAFRNNQCAAPSQQRQSTAAQTQRQSGASQDIDNCCFIGWQCNTNAEWTSGYFAFQHDQCASSPSQWQEQWAQLQRRQQRELNTPKPNGWGGWCPPDCVSSPTSVEEYEPGKFKYTYESGDELEIWHHTWDEFCELVENEHPKCTPGFGNNNPVRIERPNA